MSCGTKDYSQLKSPNSLAPKHELQSRTVTGTLGLPIDLRTYRLALTCTGEWGGDPNVGGGTVPAALAKMAAALTYVNAIYEKDLAIHFNLIASNDKLIFLDGNLDPYPNPTSCGQTLGENTNVINARV